MPFGIGIWEILILLLVALLVFGPKRLPEMGKSLGRGMREFKDSISGNDADAEREPREREPRELEPREIAPPPPPAAEPSVSATARERDTSS